MFLIAQLCIDIEQDCRARERSLNSTSTVIMVDVASFSLILPPHRPHLLDCGPYTHVHTAWCPSPLLRDVGPIVSAPGPLKIPTSAPPLPRGMWAACSLTLDGVIAGDPGIGRLVDKQRHDEDDTQRRYDAWRGRWVVVVVVVVEETTRRGGGEGDNTARRRRRDNTTMRRRRRRHEEEEEEMTRGGGGGRYDTRKRRTGGMHGQVECNDRQVEHDG